VEGTHPLADHYRSKANFETIPYGHNELNAKETVMKKFAFLLLITAVVTYGQTPAPPKPKSDAEKIASAMGAGPKFVTQNATVSTGQARPAATSGFSGLGPTGGPVFRVFLKRPTMSPVALTRSFCSSLRTVSPDVRPMRRVSGFHICMVAFGCLTSRMRWEAAMNSTLGHTS
jgi:hypothetical protein